MRSLLIISTISIFLSINTFGYGTGYSSFPLLPAKRLISTEFTGITSTGGGIGLQGRYTQKLSSRASVDAGLGISGGERDSRFFAGLNYELFPDYAEQPKISLRATFENAKEFDVRRNIVTIAPVFSKGFSFWGEEAFPFLSLPVGVNLQDDSKTYESQLSANLGITGNIPIDGYKNLIGTFETQINLKDTYTGFFIGISYPLN